MHIMSAIVEPQHKEELKHRLPASNLLIPLVRR